MRLFSNQRGFTHVELLIIIGVIGVLMFVVVFSLRPQERYKNARNAIRQNDIAIMTSTLLTAQTDELITGDVYMIVNGDMATGCDAGNDVCEVSVTSETHCVQVTSTPVSPTGRVKWDHGLKDGDMGTGYTLEKEADGTVRIRACESEE